LKHFKNAVLSYSLMLTKNEMIIGIVAAAQLAGGKTQNLSLPPQLPF
jgi:hypothetical protein